jgi:hypothetical protein
MLIVYCGVIIENNYKHKINGRVICSQLSFLVKDPSQSE